MNIDRKKCIAAIEEAFKIGRERHEKAVAEWAAHDTSEREGWITEHADSWTSALSRMRLKLRKGDPIVQADLPTTPRGWRDIAFYAGARTGQGQPRRVTGEYTPSIELRRLHTALGLLTDETVTPTQLSRLGITAGTLRNALDVMGQLADRSENA